ncbi:MAG: dihydropyrimidine dehydrogenase, partial [Clostridia bacterium]|nr:dihydropyrimidine dehydrogenase [Clostridia bacterium]
MPNMSLKKVPIPEQDPQIRNRNFAEVAFGYTPEMAMEEATRCLQCKHKPCVAGCPVRVRIPEFIEKVAAGDFEEAYHIITSTNFLPAVCGRVCPQETQCEQVCVRAIKGESVAIGRLERFVADWYMENRKPRLEKAAAKNKKVAIVGSGPAGLTCASDLAQLGYEVTIFEAFHVPGGVLMYGIPEFRLPKVIVQEEIDNLRKLGV